jgi:outer membrane protein OmpA-like peptidoglycan-associated protein
MNTRKSHLAVASAVAIVMAACASQPQRINEVEEARIAVQDVESSPDAGRYAAAEIAAAHDALRNADQLASKHKSQKDISQAAYIAKRHADIAVEQIAKGQAEEKTANAERDRAQVLLQAREQEAAAARARAEAAKQQAEAEAQRAQSAQATATATAESAQRETAELAAQLRDLQARQTDRGLVLTLGDVLFDTGKAALKPGAASTIDRLASFLEKAPDRSVAIEGHTDSVGTEGYNQQLSEERANAVKAALMAKGIPSERVTTVGKGEEEPVATNENAAGRQQNRRVEIIVSNPPSVAQRQ